MAILTATCNAVCWFRHVKSVARRVNYEAGRCTAGEYTTHFDAQLLMLQYSKMSMFRVGPPDICRCHVQTLAQACTPISVPYLQHAALEAHPHIPLAVHLHAGHSWHQTVLEALQLTGGGCCQVMCKQLAAG